MKTHSNLYILAILMLGSCTPGYISNSEKTDRKPNIFPDYTDLIIPHNIAPLNFIIEEKGEKFIAEFEGTGSKGFKVVSSVSKIIIPQRKWSSLLTHNIGKKITIKIFIETKDNKWVSFREFSDSIVSDKMDPYIVYRRINTGLVFWNNMSIVQRSIENCEEVELINNKNSKNGCIHCHTFQNNDPKNLLMHFRAGPAGTFIKTENKTLWLNSSTPHTLSGFVYPSWHPKRNLIAFSTNKINQDFHGFGHRINYVRDLASDIVLYDIDNNKVFTSPEIATMDCENLPNWSPDGKWIYFIRCPHKIKGVSDTLTKYDLLRISYDDRTEKFGKAETILSSSKTGMSISFPTVSPDGKYLVFCMADYGYFDINNPTSDLYMMDLKTFEYAKLTLNSDFAESFHCWSSNGRWLSFTSKRIDGIITIPFFSYIDENGDASKPFPLPVKDPESLKTRLFNYNRPIFVSGAIKLDQNILLDQIQQKPTNVWFDSLNVDLDAISGPTMQTLKKEETGVPYMNK
jgi:hypothetical protein